MSYLGTDSAYDSNERPAFPHNYCFLTRLDTVFSNSSLSDTNTLFTKNVGVPCTPQR